MKSRWITIAVFASVLIISRWPGLFPHNFSAVYALFFCCGALFPVRLGLPLALGMLFASDVVISLVRSHNLSEITSNLGWYIVANYIAFIAIALLGRALGKSRKFWILTTGSLLSAVVFYLITNSGSWIQLEYAKTLRGWIQALTTGLPGYPPTYLFFKNTLWSSGLFAALFAGTAALTTPAEEKEEKPAEAPSGEPATEG